MDGAIYKRYACIKANKEAKQLIEKNRSVLLIGNTGVGKTYIAAGIYNEFEGSKAWFLVADYLAELDRREKLNTTDAQSRLQDWWNIALYRELLVFDDLGTEEESEKYAAAVRRILQFRYDNQKKTIITTNLSGSELSKRYSQRLISRLYEDYTVVVIKGNDRRKEKKEVVEWQL